MDGWTGLDFYSYCISFYSTAVFAEMMQSHVSSAGFSNSPVMCKHPLLHLIHELSGPFIPEEF